MKDKYFLHTYVLNAMTSRIKMDFLPMNVCAECKIG